MKKTVLFAAAALALCLTSCTTVSKTATSVAVSNSITQQSDVDLDVSANRISYNFRPSKKERKGGLQNVKNCAVRAALQSNGNAEVLVAPEFDVRTRTGLFGQKKVKEVIVYGYPAKYKNFR